MSDTPTKKSVAKRPPRPAPKVEDDNAVFVIEAIVKRYRYMFTGGRILDVDSPYRADSTDRGLALIEAQRRWGGKKDDWKIEGVTTLRVEE